MINETLLSELKEFTDVEKIKTICKEIDNTNDKHTISQHIAELQQINNNIYDKTGFNTVTLDLQVYVNELRHEYDIVDPEELDITPDDVEFVQ